MPDEMDKIVALISRLHRVLPDLQVMVRLHPKDDGQRWGSYRDRLASFGTCLKITAPGIHMDEGGFVPPADFYREQLNAIYHCSCVLNSSSSLTVDAAILDKPIICIAYDLSFDPLFPEGRSLAYSQSVHYHKLVDTGGLDIVKSEEDCVSAISECLRDPGRRMIERREIVRVVTQSVDGKAGPRLATEILSLAKQRDFMPEHAEVA
jgi:hypothetical protein